MVSFPNDGEFEQCTRSTSQYSRHRLTNSCSIAEGGFATILLHSPNQSSCEPTTYKVFYYVGSFTDLVLARPGLVFRESVREKCVEVVDGVVAVLWGDPRKGSCLTSFLVRAAPKSWLKYTTANRQGSKHYLV